jgi:DNA or RNA helicases of superfamily II
MELKSYQKKTLDDLEDFYIKLNETNSSTRAFYQHWTEKGYTVGKDGVRPYIKTVEKTPHICVKVPTGGGKTFIAACSIKKFFNVFPRNTKVVVWLVPSDAILQQTLNNLRDHSHPYRQRLNSDFSGKVEVYDVEELLAGQNFSSDILADQLSIYVLSYDTLRSKDKLSRRIYRETSSMLNYQYNEKYDESPIEGADIRSIMVGLYDQSPLVILDESHNAGSRLSKEMLNNLNPSMILDLTATPLDTSNIVSYVSASQLKRENMVKLPVILYGRSNTQDVIKTAISIRKNLEIFADEEKKKGGQYIRPIVLFQAQSNTSDDSETFEKIKIKLLKYGIPEDEIAIKTSNINEINKMDLLSSSCSIRYIVTVNALKEGWDCPFAYVLASLSNRSSEVDVEQIIGRILRQPYTVRHKTSALNTSYVLTSSINFHSTVENVVESLKTEGFSEKDCRIAKYKLGTLDIYDGDQYFEEPSILDPEEDLSSYHSSASPEEDYEYSHIDNIPNTDTEIDETDVAKNILDLAGKQEKEYKQRVDEDENSDIPGSLEAYMKNEIRVKPTFKKDIDNLIVPKFMAVRHDTLFGGETYTTDLNRGILSEGFNPISNCNSDVSFDQTDVRMAQMDVGTESEDLNVKYLAKKDLLEFNKNFKTISDPSDKEISRCVEEISEFLDGKFDCVTKKDIMEYLNLVIKRKNIDEINYIRQNPGDFANVVKSKINDFLNQYRNKRFYDMINSNEIVCRECYKFPTKIVIRTKAPVKYEKSLYLDEETLGTFESKILSVIDSSPNVRWWHRIRARGPGEFFINGYDNHYPDFVLLTNTRILVFIESKGQHLDGTDSANKSSMSEIWDNMSGLNFKYYMVFDSENTRIGKSIQLNQLSNILDRL